MPDRYIREFNEDYEKILSEPSDVLRFVEMDGDRIENFIIKKAEKLRVSGEVYGFCCDHAVFHANHFSWWIPLKPKNYSLAQLICDTACITLAEFCHAFSSGDPELHNTDYWRRLGQEIARSHYSRNDRYIQEIRLAISDMEAAGYRVLRESSVDALLADIAKSFRAEIIKQDLDI